MNILSRWVPATTVLYEAEAAFNFALSDELAVRLAGTYAEADGWHENVTPGVDDASSIDEHALRLGVLWAAPGQS